MPGTIEGGSDSEPIYIRDNGTFRRTHPLAEVADSFNLPISRVKELTINNKIFTAKTAGVIHVDPEEVALALPDESELAVFLPGNDEPRPFNPFHAPDGQPEPAFITEEGVPVFSTRVAAEVTGFSTDRIVELCTEDKIFYQRPGKELFVAITGRRGLAQYGAIPKPGRKPGSGKRNSGAV